VAIAFDAASVATGETGTSHTHAHTCTGDNRILFCYTEIGSASDVVTGVTYATVAMTRVNRVAADADEYMSLYYLIAPATGANNIVISTSSSVFIGTAATSYTGAEQSGVPDSQATNTGTSTAPTATTTVVDTDSWTIAVTRRPAGNAAGTPTAGTTERAGAGANTRLGDSNAAVAAGARSLGWEGFDSGSWGEAIASFSVVGGAPPATAPMFLVF